jgi:hypothetical protein
VSANIQGKIEQSNGMMIISGMKKNAKSHLLNKKLFGMDGLTQEGTIMGYMVLEQLEL